MSLKRELEETCPLCHAELIEEKREYKGESLAVAVCPSCHYLDWIVPESEMGIDAEYDLPSQAWAEEQAENVLREHDLWFNIHYSEVLELNRHLPRIRLAVEQLCLSLGAKTAEVGQYKTGLKIILSEINPKEIERR